MKLKDNPFSSFEKPAAQILRRLPLKNGKQIHWMKGLGNAFIPSSYTYLFRNTMILFITSETVILLDIVRFSKLIKIART